MKGCDHPCNRRSHFPTNRPSPSSARQKEARSPLPGGRGHGGFFLPLEAGIRRQRGVAIAAMKELFPTRVSTPQKRGGCREPQSRQPPWAEARASDDAPASAQEARNRRRRSAEGRKTEPRLGLLRRLRPNSRRQPAEVPHSGERSYSTLPDHRRRPQHEGPACPGSPLPFRWPTSHPTAALRRRYRLMAPPSRRVPQIPT